ncbi:MAG TPA: CHAT domain-containing protein [Blastocatellia bacterium]|nr:CHAT domain-containing protein [Blastocatellia bacterium]
MPPFSLGDAKDLLPDRKTVLLNYLVLDDSTLLFVITRQAEEKGEAAGKPELNVYRLPVGREALALLVEGFRRNLAERNLNFREQAREMYGLLLKPAEDHLRGSATLCIVPDGGLWEMPFQALQTPQGRYLVEDQAVFYAPSLSILREMMKRRRDGDHDVPPGERLSKSAQAPQGKPTLIAFGNPEIDARPEKGDSQFPQGNELVRLPEAEKELKILKQLYGAERSKIYVGTEAQEERFKSEAPGFSVIHFATHSILDELSPMYSYIMLSQAPGAKGEDGLLEAREILEMSLSADLVVLSACETGRGRTASGEGMLGMSWAIFVAGCPTTVVSQWKVDSASTSQLMVEFHKNLLSQTGKNSATASKAEALRRASLKLMASGRYRHPFYWSGFVVIGNGF